MAYMLKIGPYDVSLRAEVGAGTFGKVYRGRHKENGTEVAAKKIVLDGSQEGKDFVQTEITSLKRAKHHPFILHLLYHEFIDYLDDFTNTMVHELWLVTEMCSAGNLATYHAKNEVSFEEKVRIARQSAGAIAFLHNMDPPILHRDIKPGNILMKLEGGLIGIKMADFGLAQSSSDKSVFSTFGGSLHYMAPEYFGPSHKHRKSVDVFALGLVLGYLLIAVAGQNLDSEGFVGSPFGQAMWNAKREKKALPILVKVDMGDDEYLTMFKKIVIAMTRYNADERPTMDKVDLQFINLHEKTSNRANKTRTSSSGAMPKIQGESTSGGKSSTNTSKLTGKLAKKFDAVKMGLGVKSKKRQEEVTRQENAQEQGNPDVVTSQKAIPQANPPLSTPTPHHLLLVGGYSAVDGAFDDITSDKVYSHTRPLQGWQPLTKTPHKLQDPAVCGGVGDGFLLIGGLDRKRQVSRECHYFSMKQLKWARWPDMPTARDGAAAVLVGDRVLVIGGNAGKSSELKILDSVEAFDVRSRVWSSRAFMKQGMVAPITAVIGKTVCVVFNDDSANKPTQHKDEISLQLYSAHRDTWTYGAPLPKDKGRTWGARAVATGDSMIVAGGDSTICVQYFLGKDTWVKLAKPFVGHHYGSLVKFEGSILFLGGTSYRTIDNKGERTPDTVVEVYDVLNDDWSVRRDMEMLVGLWGLHVVEVNTD